MAKIAIVTAFYSTHGSGIEIFTHGLAKRLNKSGEEVIWISSDLKEGIPEDISTSPIPSTNWIEKHLHIPYPVWNPRSYLLLGRIIKSVDLVHVHDSFYMGNIIVSLLAKWFSKPLILTQHIGNIPYNSYLKKFYLSIANAIITRFIMYKADHIIFISNVVANYYDKLLKKNNYSIIYNGTDELFFQRNDCRRIEDDKFLVLFVGRFVEKKRVDKLRKLAKKHPDIEWNFAGRGPLNPEGWNLKNVNVLNQLSQNELAGWYQKADLLVLPSVGEGFPLVVQEAMSCGLPCLVSEEIRQACPEAAHLMFSAGACGEDVADKFTEIIKDKEKLKNMRKQIAEYARSAWSWDECIKKHLSIYNKILLNEHKFSH